MTDTEQLSLRKWLSNPERRLAEIVVTDLGRKIAAEGAMRAMMPNEGKQAAAKSDFLTAARYQHFLEVLSELDSTPMFHRQRMI